MSTSRAAREGYRKGEDKYSSRILELMRSHTGSGTKQGKEGSERGAKKIKKKDKNVIYVESGEEE
jgi:hypothetical protein